MDETDYEVIVVGGGPGGLSAALYTTRLGHATAVIDRGGGRAAMMADTHNVIGVTEDVSGKEYLATGRQQVEEYGADWHRDYVDDVAPIEDGGPFLVHTAGDEEFTTERVVLATGFSDERPDPPLPRTARGLHYCLHCDAYMFVDEPVYVMGHGESAAHVAMIMLNFADSVDLLLRDHEPEWSEETDRQLRAHPVEIVEEEVSGIENGEDGWLESIEFEDGTVRKYTGGFAMYGSEYRNELAEQLGCEINDDGTVAVDDHGNTSVPGVYAVGDLTPGHNQVPISLADGARTGIDIHYDLRTFPKSLDELDQIEESSVPAVPGRIRQAKAEMLGDD